LSEEQTRGVYNVLFSGICLKQKEWDRRTL
jgi:hypothetical protein